MMNNNSPFRGVLGQMPAAPTGAPMALNYGPRAMYSGGPGPGTGNFIPNKFRPGEMNFGQFGGGNAYPFQGFLPPGVGGFGGGQGMNNFPGVLSGGFRRGY